MKLLIYGFILCLISFVISTDFQMIDLFQDNYKTYLVQLENDVSHILDGYANKDIYSIQDIVNTTIYTADQNIKKLDSWVVVRTFKFYNITHMYHFQYKVNDDNTLKLISSSDQFNILQSWLQDSDAISFFNLIDMLKGFLCKSHKICGDLDLTKKFTKNPNQGCWKTDVTMELYGKLRTSLLGCYLTDKDTNLTYHASVYSDMNTALSINKTLSFYYMDYLNYEQEIYIPTSESFSINNQRTVYADKRIQQLFNDNLVVKPSGYKPFKPDGPDPKPIDENGGLGGFIIFLIVLSGLVILGVCGYLGWKFYKKTVDSKPDNSFVKI